MSISDDHTKRAPDRMAERLEELSRLLRQQIDDVREGQLDRVERLAARAETLVAGVIHDRQRAGTLAESQRAHLARLYEELALALRAERGDVQAKLRQLRQVKRAIGAYGRKARTGSPSPATFGDRARIKVAK